MNMRTRLIQKIINFNEQLLFYPKLRKFYITHFSDKKPVIIDVGSNKGQSIDFFMKLNPKSEIFGFEPNTTLFKKLEIKYKNNPKVKLRNVGVSNKVGRLIFHENIMDETSTFEELNLDSEYLKKKARILGVSAETIVVDSYEVEVTRLSSFLEEHAALFFDVLKIDVEGHELNCIEGLFNGTNTNFPIRFIQLESHNDDMYLKNNNHNAIADLLHQNGFVKVAKIKHGFGDFYEIIYENKHLS